MIGVDDIQEIVKIALCTGKVMDERPLSLLIIAAVGAGKTDIISRYSEKYVDSVLYVTDITPFAIHKKHGKQLKRGLIRHIVCPDLLNMLGKPKEQSDAFVVFMNGIIEEGIARVESRNSDFIVDMPVRCGFITSVANKELNRKKDKWASVGFLSRMLPISYSYKQETVVKIFEHIINREYTVDNPQALKLPPETYVYLPVDLAEQVQPYAIATKDDNDQYGFRRLKQLQTFIMGRALLYGRNEVVDEDLDVLDKYAKYMRYDCAAHL